MNNLKYELNNMSKLWLSTLLFTVIVNAVILSGAFCIGFFDQEADNQIFEYFNSLIGISDSLTGLIIAIFLSIKACKYMVAHYLNDNKIRLFLFPNGRKGILIHKINAMGLISIVSELMGLLLINAFLLIIVKFTSILPNHINLLNLIAVTIASVLFSLAALIISVVLGIRFSSKVVTVMTSIILIVILCNMLGILCANLPRLSLGIALVTLVVDVMLIKYCTNYLKNDELLR